MIPILLLSTIGYSVEIHFCKGQIQNVGFYSVDPCNMKLAGESQGQKIPVCHNHLSIIKKTLSKNYNPNFSSSKCCYDKQYNFTSTIGETLTKLDKSGKLNLQAVLIFIAIDFGKFEGLNFSFENLYYKPPLLSHDLSLLNRIFRI